MEYLMFFPISLWVMLKIMAQVYAVDLSNAQAELHSKNDSSVEGSVTFKDSPEGLVINYRIAGLEPNSKHGFHIHERGNCKSPDGKSAGPHYIKMSKSGGTSKDFPGHYAGDLPELDADSQGVAEGSVIVKDLTVSGKHAVINRAVIVHDGADDVKQKSSKRVGCGVIRAAIPAENKAG